MKGEKGKDQHDGFSYTCFPCKHYRMQGCVNAGEGHPTIGPRCRRYEVKGLEKIEPCGDAHCPLKKVG